jgi:hypothetical protein
MPMSARPGLGPRVLVVPGPAYRISSSLIELRYIRQLILYNLPRKGVYSLQSVNKQQKKARKTMK